VGPLVGAAVGFGVIVAESYVGVRVGLTVGALVGEAVGLGVGWFAE